MSDENKGNLIGLAFIAIVAAIGVYIVSVGLGRAGRSPGVAPNWVLISAGVAFLLTAASFALSAIGGIVFGAKTSRDGSLTNEAPYALRVGQTVLGLAIVTAMVAVALWVTHTSPLLPVGKAVFSIAAAAIWSFFAAFTIWRLRRLPK